MTGLEPSTTSRRITLDGRLHLACDNEWCVISAREDAVKLTASSLKALRRLTAVDFGCFSNLLAPMIAKLGLRLDVHVGDHLVARVGSHANPGLASRILQNLGIGGQIFSGAKVQLMPVTIARAGFTHPRIPKQVE